ncbi:hypothetical protein J6590_070626 [Homalodisca vitripennis]|nr:hypothetical protein J6590_070626 [Homalodisca vitripennis]
MDGYCNYLHIPQTLQRTVRPDIAQSPPISRSIQYTTIYRTIYTYHKHCSVQYAQISLSRHPSRALSIIQQFIGLSTHTTNKQRTVRPDIAQSPPISRSIQYTTIYRTIYTYHKHAAYSTPRYRSVASHLAFYPVYNNLYDGLHKPQTLQRTVRPDIAQSLPISRSIQYTTIYRTVYTYHKHCSVQYVQISLSRHPSRALSSIQQFIELSTHTTNTAAYSTSRYRSVATHLALYPVYNNL